MSGIIDVQENVEEVENQDKNNETQEEILVSSSVSDKTGDNWESLLEMKLENMKMTRSLSTESVLGSNDEDLQGNTLTSSLKENEKGSDDEEVLESERANLIPLQDDSSSDNLKRGIRSPPKLY